MLSEGSCPALRAQHCALTTVPSALRPQHCAPSTRGVQGPAGGLHRAEASQLTSSWNEIPENVL